MNKIETIYQSSNVRECRNTNSFQINQGIIILEKKNFELKNIKSLVKNALNNVNEAIKREEYIINLIKKESNIIAILNQSIKREEMIEKENEIQMNIPKVTLKESIMNFKSKHKKSIKYDLLK